MLNLRESNKYIINLINKNEPFFISRLGCEIINSHNYVVEKKLFYSPSLNINAGIYHKTVLDIKKYYQLYYSSVMISNAISVFITLDHIKKYEEYFIKNIEKPSLTYQVLEPFYIILENEKPWTHYLLGKKVLVVSPFVNSFQKQISNNFKMFKNKDNKNNNENENDNENDIFLPNQEFVFYKSFNTLAGNHVHNNWIETFNIMCQDIEKLEFDIALVSCGGYGLPLCNFIKTNMKKSTIYVGGGLQLLFGVIGKRWLSNQTILKIINENQTKFIRPSDDEIVKNKNLVEGGSYW